MGIPEQTKENGICPKCGYPSYAGHGPTCQKDSEAKAPELMEEEPTVPDASEQVENHVREGTQAGLELARREFMQVGEQYRSEIRLLQELVDVIKDRIRTGQPSRMEQALEESLETLRSLGGRFQGISDELSGQEMLVQDLQTFRTQQEQAQSFLELLRDHLQAIGQAMADVSDQVSRAKHWANEYVAPLSLDVADEVSTLAGRLEFQFQETGDQIRRTGRTATRAFDEPLSFVE